MNHPDTLPIDIDEMRAWANGYKTEKGLSWKQFGDETGLPGGTLQPFCTGKYAGDNGRIAREIFKFMQAVQSRIARRQGIPVDPGFFETPTSLRVRGLLAIAQTGRITFGAMGAGLGKTRTAEDFAERTRPVWLATMRESSRKMNAMIQTVERVIGLQATRSWPHLISQEIVVKMRGQRGTLIIDEANHLEYAAFEEIRAWHDATGVGVCFLGNEELLARIESGRQRDAFARLNSRIAQRLVQNLPDQGDITAFCDAWGIMDPGMRRILSDVALVPGSGGLRECRQIVEAASMLAADDGDGLELAHMTFAVENRARRILR
jgi:DNA transposition AAA+ family ATPase